MTLTLFFLLLGAPLANQRWSWGGVREDGSVVLRVWRDEIKEGRVCVLRPLSPGEAKSDNGYNERRRHLELIKAGARSHLVMCTAKDVNVRPRTIDGFDTDSVYVGGELTEIDGEYWLELGGRVAARELYPR